LGNCSECPITFSASRHDTVRLTCHDGTEIGERHRLGPNDGLERGTVTHNAAGGERGQLWAQRGETAGNEIRDDEMQDARVFGQELPRERGFAGVVGSGDDDAAGHGAPFHSMRASVSVGVAL
jgi:hypothetical protein